MITNKRKHTCFYKIIHFSVQFSAIGVSTQLQSSGLVAHENSTFRNLALAVSGPFMA